MQQLSTHEIQLNAVDDLNINSVTAIRFEIFKVGSKTPFIVKSLGNGIAANANGWKVTIDASEINLSGDVYREVYFVSDGKEYRKPFGYTNIKESLTN